MQKADSSLELRELLRTSNRKSPQIAGAVRVRHGSGPATKRARWHYDATSMQGSSMTPVRRFLTKTSLRVRKKAIALSN